MIENRTLSTALVGVCRYGLKGSYKEQTKCTFRRAKKGIAQVSGNIGLSVFTAHFSGEQLSSLSL
jgi:hypothetical protein